MEIGIVGLPYAGKSTIFSTLLRHRSEISAGKQSAERGIVKIPDPRLDNLTKIVNRKKQVNATIEYVKAPGLDLESAQAKGLPAQFLLNLKNVEALLVVIRNFENEYFPHPLGRIDPAADITLINSEFLLNDLMQIESRLDKLHKLVQKIQNERDKRELELLYKLKEQLDQEKTIREQELTEDEKSLIKGYQFLTAKPLLFVVNLQENQIKTSGQIENELKRLIDKNCAITSLSAEIEKEIAELEAKDAAVFMEDLGIAEPAMHKLIRKSYELLGLISFFTIGDKECRAWTIRQGSNAHIAAGVIHSDLEKGFIRAETIPYDAFIIHKSLANCREKGLLRLEGKEYIVKDGDILTIRFNV